jgi:hypothetical protein
MLLSCEIYQCLRGRKRAGYFCLFWNSHQDSFPRPYPPHFHAEYQGYQAYFGIEDGKIIEGEFPPKLISIVRDWANEHRAELEVDWNLAQQRQPLNRIPGADQ